MNMFRRPVLLALVAFVAGAGIAVDSASAQPANVVVVQQPVYTYPEGRYELRGDGTPRSPYYWVWIPRGTLSQTPAPRYRYEPDVRTTDGRIESIGWFGRNITLDGEEFDIPSSSAVATAPAVGQQVIVTYYVAQDGRKIVRSIEPSSAR